MGSADKKIKYTAAEVAELIRSLARQENIWARQGMELSRTTLANWVIQCTQNWRLCDSAKGAESSPIVYSLVETAKANGIDPYEYLCWY